LEIFDENSNYHSVILKEITNSVKITQGGAAVIKYGRLGILVSDFLVNTGFVNHDIVFSGLPDVRAGGYAYSGTINISSNIYTCIIIPYGNDVEIGTQSTTSTGYGRISLIYITNS
jgi:hypothetical protein